MQVSVSIITPIFNSYVFISRLYRSVVEQSYQDFEFILVDDCSSDGSLSAIKTIMKSDSRVRLVQLKVNSGAAIARNEGIKIARGRYIAFLDSDDFWFPDKLQKQMLFMINNNYVFTYTAYNKVNANDCLLSQVQVPDKVSYSDLLKTCYIGCLTVIYDTKFFGKVYMPSGTKREDFATWLRMLKKVDYAYGLNEILANYRVHPHQSSSNKLNMARENWILYRRIEGLEYHKSIYYFLNYVARGLLRTKTPKLAKYLGLFN